MTLWFGLAWLKRDNSIVDIAWGLGFVILTWLHFGINVATWSMSHWLLLFAITAWGLRLTAHIAYRNLLSGVEDWRYAAWRKEWGESVVWRAFLQVFMLQGFFMGIIMLPILLCPAKISAVSHPLIFWVRSLGFILFLFGFIYESLADYQLLEFKQSVRLKDEILNTGLWKYSRHPNYFGEIVVWIGIFFIACPFPNWQEAVIAAISPLTMIWLLNRVSGIPLLEQKLAQNGTYKKYVETTPPLLPDWFK